MLHPKDLRGKVEMVFQATLEEPNSFLKRESASVMLKKDERCLQKPCSKLNISIVSDDMIFWQVEATKKMNLFLICLPFWWWSVIVSWLRQCWGWMFLVQGIGCTEQEAKMLLEDAVEQWAAALTWWLVIQSSPNTSNMGQLLIFLIVF